MRVIHCSFDLVEKFTPRVPETRVGGHEEGATPRICAAPSVLDCLRAIPQSGETIRWMRETGLKPVIHAYYLYADEKDIVFPSEDLVPDAGFTHEIWVLREPEKVTRRDYEILSCRMVDGVDRIGHKVVEITDVEIARCRNTDSLSGLVARMGFDYGSFVQRFPYVNIRELATNIPSGIIREALKGEQHAEKPRERNCRRRKGRIAEVSFRSTVVHGSTP